VSSGSRKKRHNNHHLFEKSALLAETQFSRRKQPSQQEQPQIEKSNQRTNLTRFGQCAYVLGAREREILLIQESITNYSFFKEFPMEIFSGIFRDTIHEAFSPYL